MIHEWFIVVYGNTLAVEKLAKKRDFDVIFGELHAAKTNALAFAMQRVGKGRG